MKTLINKNNPKIRITAPEIERRKAMFYQDEHYCLIIKGLPWLDADDWTLVEEENMKTIRLSNTTNPLPVVEEEPKNISFAERLKERLENMTQEEFEKAMNEIYVEGDESPTLEEYLKTAYHSPIETEPVDLEEEIKKHTDLFHADIEYPLRLTAIKFYELGRTEGIKGNLEEIPSNVDLEKATEEYIEKRASLAPDEQWDIEDMRDAVRFGAKWMKEQTKK